MEYVGIESIKNSYVEVLQENGEQEKALELEAKDFTTPVFNNIKIHPEEEPNREILNNGLRELGIDFMALDNQLISMSQEYNDLMNNVLTDLDVIDEIIVTEEERIQDMNIILGNFDEFSSVKSLTSSDLSGTCSIIDKNTFMTNCSGRTIVPLSVVDVSGNGYEGNKYVYNNETFEEDSMSTSIKDYIIDDSSSSYYEYSRLTSSIKQNDYPSDVNFDNNEAECTITLNSDLQFNTIKLQSDLNNITIKQVQTSDDGVTYSNTIKEPIRFNDKVKKYDNEDYIYGTGIICFPNTNNLKVTLSSSGVTDDQLAFKKINLNDIILTRNTVFNFYDYITEYLVPIFGYYYSNESNQSMPIPLSIMIAMTLLFTKNSPDDIGAFNFWNLDYNKNLVRQKSDKGKCAFYDRDEAILAIVSFLNFDYFEEAFEEMPSISRMTKGQKNTLMFRLLKLMKNNYESLYMTGLDYLEHMNLYTLDDKNIDKINNTVALKYEQWFYRKDKQETAYQKMIDEAQTIIPLNNVKRHLIRVNDITAFTGNYASQSYLETGELVTGQVSSIAIFANEYVPPSFKEGTYFEYILVVNGIEYDIVPINCHRNGTKVIRYSGYSITENYTKHISEPIKTAKLAIKITTPDNSTSPYISNIKICLGKAVTK